MGWGTLQVEGMFRAMFMNHAYNKNSCRKKAVASSMMGGMRHGLPFMLGQRNMKFMGGKPGMNGHGPNGDMAMGASIKVREPAECCGSQSGPLLEYTYPSHQRFVRQLGKSIRRWLWVFAALARQGERQGARRRRNPWRCPALSRAEGQGL